MADVQDGVASNNAWISELHWSDWCGNRFDDQPPRLLKLHGETFGWQRNVSALTQVCTITAMAVCACVCARARMRAYMRSVGGSEGWVWERRLLQSTWSNKARRARPPPPAAQVAIRNAGHMVPQDQPRAARAMIEQWVDEALAYSSCGSMATQ